MREQKASPFAYNALRAQTKRLPYVVNIRCKGVQRRERAACTAFDG